MNYRRLGSSGLKVSELGLGTNAFGKRADEKTSIRIIEHDRTPERELVPLCLDQGVGIIPYFPLAGGILTGKYNQDNRVPSGSRADTDPNFQRFLEDHNLKLGTQVSQLAAEHGHSPSALSLAWLIHRPAVSTVIVGATKTEQLDDNLKSLDIKMDDSLARSLDEISEPFVHGKPFATYRLD
ncbi:hypothetical protein J31TS3_24880 [Paenibacillus lactis]|nr:aldo/keto reductase [Paenibacillus lactis]GIO91261.1 hypothetical protein J31TS3_24880 [Paenibacillus lactis]